MPGEMVCVHRASSIGEADIVTAWLEEQGIPAFVKNRHGIATLNVPVLSAPHGVEVCVADDETAAQARDVLAEHAREIAEQSRATRSSAPVEATCEDCGRSSVFPPTQRGTVQTCPNCRGNIDVPES